MTTVLSGEQSGALAEFARACKAAARSVSLYPSTHPAIRAALGRMTAAAARLTATGPVTLAASPEGLVVDGRAPARPDPALGELALLLHERLIGELTIERAADADDWLALLLLLGRAPDELFAQGGIARAWAATGRSHFTIREIDYAEVLRERAGGDTADWDRIIAFCLRGDATSLDERALASLLEAVSDVDRFGALLERLQQAPAAAGTSIGARAAALLQLLRTVVDTLTDRDSAQVEPALQTMADATARLTPDMLLAMLAHRSSPDPEQAAVASAVAERIAERTVVSFVANNVVAERGATERLALAFEALVPEAERKERLLPRVEDAVRETNFGREAGFEDLWRGAADMLMSYSDEKFVSDSYARELSATRTLAIEVERVSDDPPGRIEEWVSTVSDTSLRQLDLDLLLDLLRVEEDAGPWRDVAAMVADEIERRTLMEEPEAARQLADALLREQQPGGRTHLAATARAAGERLATGPLARHVVMHLRKADEAAVSALAKLCHTIGPGIVRLLAEALAVEENGRAIRGLREILLGFGAAGRQSVEQLKTSNHPAVRRTAIDLLRVLGGDEALPELESMLGDADPQVQREAVRAIVQIGSKAAYAVLERAVVASTAARETIVQQLIGLRDDKATPLLCYVLEHTQPRGNMAQAHAAIVQALGTLSPHPDSVKTLRAVLHRGLWWAPFRTALLREAAAAALQRIGSAEALAVLEEAAATGSRAVRKIARARTPGRRRGQEPA